MFVYIVYVLASVLLAMQFELAKCVEMKDVILLELAQELQIHRIIFMTDKKEKAKNIKDAKMLSMHFIPMQFENYEDLEKSFVENTIPNLRTALIYKGNVSAVVNILDKLKQMAILHRASRYIWIIFLEICLAEKVFYVPYDCEFVMICPKDSTTFQLLETYTFGNMTSIIDFGIWNKNSGLIISEKFFYRRRTNLNNTVFNIKNAFPEYLCVKARSCILWDYLNYVSQTLNFSLRWVPDKIDFLAKEELQEFDFYHGVVAFHADYNPVSENLIAPFYTFDIDWYIKYPNVQLQGDYFRPFDLDLWEVLCFAILKGILTLSLFLLTKQIFVDKRQPIGYVDCAFAALDCFLNQAGTKNTPFKIPIYTLRLTALFIVAAYSATITSFLALRIPDIPFNTLDGFLENGEYSIAQIPGEFSQSYFKNRSNPSIRLANEKFSRILQKKEMPDIICDEKVAMLLIDWEISRFEKKCRLLKMEKSLDIMFTAMPLPINSPFTKICNYLLISLYTSGIMQIHQTRTHRDLFETNRISNNNLCSVELTQVTQILFIIPMGITIAIIFLICEVILKYFISSKIQKF